MLSRLTVSYQTCPTVEAYLQAHPFDSVYVQDPRHEDYRYCFGDYTRWISNHSLNAPQLMTIIQSLLTLYDERKGYYRRYVGDNDEITLIRKVAEGHGLSLLDKVNFDLHHYDYATIHAHYQCEISLSTLIIRLIEHNVGWYNGTQYKIDPDICRMARTAHQFS
jgi:hypothetical protein